MVTFRARTAFCDESQAVIVVESIDIRGEQADAMLWLFARTEPVAVVISGQGSPRAVDMGGKPTDLDRLLRETAGLRALLGA